MSVTLYGLADYENQTLAVFLAGLDCGDFPVVNAQIVIPTDGSLAAGLLTDHYLSQVSAMDRDWGIYTMYLGTWRLPVVLGFRYQSRGQLVRPVEAEDVGSLAGPGFGKFKRQHQAAVMVSSTKGLSLGTDFSRMHPILMRSPGDRAFSPTELADGILVDAVDDDSSYDSMLAWQVDGPYSTKITALGGFIKTEDR